MEPHGIQRVSFSWYSPASSPVFLFSFFCFSFIPLIFLISGQSVHSFAVSHPSLSSSLNHVSLPRSQSPSTPPLPLHLLYCKQLTKAWQGLCSCSPCLPHCSPSYLLLSPCYRVCLSLSRFLYSVFSSASEKQKLIKYGTRRSSISLNHHVIKMASLGDQLKRSREQCLLSQIFMGLVM